MREVILVGLIVYTSIFSFSLWTCWIAAIRPSLYVLIWPVSLIFVSIQKLALKEEFVPPFPVPPELKNEREKK
jgi:hypothetical protein